MIGAKSERRPKRKKVRFDRFVGLRCSGNLYRKVRGCASIRRFKDERLYESSLQSPARCSSQSTPGSVVIAPLSGLDS